MPEFVPDEWADEWADDVVETAKVPVVPIDALAAVFVGGAIGGIMRYALARAWPVHAGHFPWATLLTNIIGCALIGVLMVIVLETATPHRLARPFLGVGVLGGFTTFSTFAVETDRLISSGQATTAIAYLAASLVGCLVAVWLATTLTRRWHPLTRTQGRAP